MISISNEFAKELYNDNRNYEVDITIELNNGTTLNLTNDQVWSSSFKVEDSVSGDSDLDIGAVIINQFSISINNIYDDFSDYDFTNAVIRPYVGLQLSSTREMLPKGVFIADEVKYNGSLINIKAIDNMSKFDRDSADTNLEYPASLASIIRDACTVCGVTLSTYTFPNSDYIVEEMPHEKSTTFRELIAYAAQIAGCFARCNKQGYLVLDWFDTDKLDWDEDFIDGGVFDSSTPYASGEDLDGGTFYPWSDDGGDYDGGAFGDRKYIHFITSTTSFDLGVDDIVITGVRVTAKSKQVTLEGDEGAATIMDSQLKGVNAALLAKKNSYISQLETLDAKIERLEAKKNKSDKQKKKLKALRAERAALSDEYYEFMHSEAWSVLNSLLDLQYAYNDAVAEYGEESPEAYAALAEYNEAYNEAISILNTESVEVYLDERDATISYLAGEEGYVIELTDNPFITEFSAQEIAYKIGEQLIGLTYRRGTVTHQNDPSIEAGDVALVWDRKGNSYPILVTSTTFTVGSTQTTRSAGETPARKSSQQYTDLTKTWVETWEEVEQEKTTREQMIEKMSEYVASKAGLYFTKEEGDQGNIYYLHDQPTLENSSIIWKMNAVSMSVSTDGGQTFNLALNCDGDIIAQRLSAVGIDANWIETGEICVMNPNTKEVTFSANYENGKVKIVADEFSLSGGRELEAVDQTARDEVADALSEIASVSSVADSASSTASAASSAAALANGTLDNRATLLSKVFSTYSTDGIYLINGKLAINATALKACAIQADYITGGTLDFSKITTKNLTLEPSSVSGNLTTKLKDGQIQFWYNTTSVGSIAASDYNTIVISSRYYMTLNSSSMSLNGATVYLGRSGGSVYSQAISNATVATGARTLGIGSAGQIRPKESSSRRYKHDIKDLGGDLGAEKLYDIKVRQFKFNADYLCQEDDRYLKDVPGFVAEEVYDVYPIAADKNENGTIEDWNVRYIVPPMLKLIQDQHETIVSLTERVSANEKKIAELEERLSKLEQLL